MVISISARQRILDTAAALFYAEGVHAVGVDRIIARAGVAKATFYHHFPAKDDLVAEYLREQYRLQREAYEAVSSADPRETLLAIFEYMGEFGANPAYRGCPFVNAAAEYPDRSHPVRRVIAEQRRWTVDRYRSLLADAGDPDPDRTAAALMLLRDGIAVGADLDDPASVRHLVRDAAVRLLTFSRKVVAT